MKTALRTDITIAAICKGFTYNELEGKGLHGLDGKLTIQPEYQRNYIYAADGGKRAKEIHGRPVEGKGGMVATVGSGRQCNGE